MRRAGFVVAMILAAGAIAPPASAGSDSPHLRVDSRVTQGSRLGIKVRDCESGAGWDATIVIEIFDADISRTLYHKEYDPSETGRDRFKVKIKAARYPAAKYFVRAVCVHNFDSGGQGTFFDELETFQVEEP